MYNCAGGAKRYYLSISNYRTWEVTEIPQRGLRLPQKDVAERGIQVTGDFNDRYAFNEQENYRSSREMIRPLIDGGLAAIGESVEAVKGAQE